MSWSPLKRFPMGHILDREQKFGYLGFLQSLKTLKSTVLHKLADNVFLLQPRGLRIRNTSTKVRQVIILDIDAHDVIWDI